MNALEQIVGVFQAILPLGQVGVDVRFGGGVEALVQIERREIRDAGREALFIAILT